MNLTYAQWLKLPIHPLERPWKIFNIDGTENKSRELKYYTNLEVQTGTTRSPLRFFLTDLGENKAILGYSWFAATQPKIDWERGWIDSSQLPIIFRALMQKKPDLHHVPLTNHVLLQRIDTISARSLSVKS